MNLLYWLWNTVVNVIFLFAHLTKIKQGSRELKRAKRSIDDISILQFYIDKMFEYRKDKFPWTSWAINFAIKGLSDDCDGLANFCKWIARKNGWKPARYYSIYSNKWGHAVCRFIYKGQKYLAGTKGVRKFKSWKFHFPEMEYKRKRWL